MQRIIFTLSVVNMWHRRSISLHLRRRNNVAIPLTSPDFVVVFQGFSRAWHNIFQAEARLGLPNLTLNLEFLHHAIPGVSLSDSPDFEQRMRSASEMKSTPQCSTNRKGWSTKSNMIGIASILLIQQCALVLFEQVYVNPGILEQVHSLYLGTSPTL